jgi:ureidoglycolate lyase
MGTRGLVPRPLTAGLFAPFGNVVTSEGRAGRPINAGTSVRIEMPDLDVVAEGGAPSLSVFRASARRLPIDVRELERHRLSSQTFLPLGRTAFVAVVALGDAAPDPATLAAFYSDGRVGITIRRGVWHHALLSLEDGDYAVIERRGAHVDCDVVELARPERLHAALA